MTVIDRVGSPAAGRPGARAATGNAGAAGFPPPAEPGAGAACSGGVAASVPVTLDSLLALQQVDEPTERDRAARRHGQALLAALGRLQRLLLEDGDQAAALAQIRTLAEATPAAADPGLAAALDLVVLRARIELARRGA
jgi:hypothetical protein